MKLESPTSMSKPRRRFIFMTALVGLSAVTAPLAVPRLLKALRFEPGFYEGPFVSAANDLLGRLNRTEITPEQFITELHDRYNEMPLPDEFAAWVEAGPEKWGRRLIYQSPDSLPHRQQMKLLYIKPNSAHAPHAHHNMLSAQCIVKGRVHVRQYERIERLDDRTLALRPVSDQIFNPYDTILTTEHLTNVHWFGANDQPAVVVNYNAIDGFDRTFEPKSRETGRYFVDPTVSARHGELIAAPEIDPDTAADRFEHQPLSTYPSAMI